ncbi:MAG: dTDP-4-dehydrorhamnose reductase [Hyphomicrobiales bacterium]|nr:MAG: dTDP-4-dehydrorhamnose reductase [Hyphomicrobiales bacterium]
MSPRILVAGAEGQVARSLVEAAHECDVPMLALGRSALDLTALDALPAGALAFRPTLIVNAAAYTAVDKAESEREAAFAVNATGAGKLAALATEAGLPIIHLSTDYVFDGEKSTPYCEDDATNPRSVYGASKLAGEAAVAAANPRHIILRTAWVHSPFGSNFVKTMLRLGRERDRLRVVADQIGSPTYAGDLANAILHIATKTPASGWHESLAGIYHAAGASETSWHGLAQTVFATAHEIDGRPMPSVEAIATIDYPTAAERPANSRLDCTKLARTFGIALPDWRDGVRRCVERLVTDGA